MYGHRLPVLWALKWFACKLTTVPDPDLEIKGGGGKGRGADLRKNFFRPFGPQFGLKIRGRGEGSLKTTYFNSWIICWIIYVNCYHVITGFEVASFIPP